jgi:hypothetical protein
MLETEEQHDRSQNVFAFRGWHNNEIARANKMIIEWEDYLDQVRYTTLAEYLANDCPEVPRNES